MQKIRFKPENIEQVPNTSGLYFLYCKQELLYIGKAKFLKNRIVQHYKQNSVILHSIRKLVNILGKEIIDMDPIFIWTDTIMHSQRIDLELKRITRIELRYIPHAETMQEELRLIRLLKPRLNYQTLQNNNLESLFRFCNKIDNLLLNQIW